MERVRRALPAACGIVAAILMVAYLAHYIADVHNRFPHSGPPGHEDDFSDPFSVGFGIVFTVVAALVGAAIGAALASLIPRKKL